MNNSNATLIRMFSWHWIQVTRSRPNTNARWEPSQKAENGWQNLAKRDRIRMFDLARLAKQVKVELGKAHFHQSDRKFVRLAISTESKRLVAEESDYSKAVCKVLKKHAGVVVHSASDACDWIAVRRETES